MLQVIEHLQQLHGHEHSVLLVLPRHGQAFQDGEDFVRLRTLQDASAIPVVAGLKVPPGQDGASTKYLAFQNNFQFEENHEATEQEGEPSMRTATPSPISLSVPTMQTQGTRRVTPRILLASLALILVVSAIGALLLHYTSSSVIPAAPKAIGQAAFVNSQQGGISAEVQVRLPALPTLSAGEVYTVWLMSDQKQSDTVWLSLGSLHTGEQVQTLAPSGASNINLLSTYSQLCITASSLSFIPMARSDCRYYGEITQKPNDQDSDHYSLLDHVRHLLSSDLTLESLHIPNGLIYNFNFQLAKINEWASAAANDSIGDMPLVHRHMVRILDALDGSKYVEKDVPLGTGLLVDPTSIGVGVLLGDAGTPSYLGHIEKHLRGILASPGVTADQERLAAHILDAMESIAAELEPVYHDARLLVRMSDVQLAHATKTLQDLATNASNAYAGGYDTALAQTRTDGSKDLYTTFQHFGILDIYRA